MSLVNKNQQTYMAHKLRSIRIQKFEIMKLISAIFIVTILPISGMQGLANDAGHCRKHGSVDGAPITTPESLIGKPVVKIMPRLPNAVYAEGTNNYIMLTITIASTGAPIGVEIAESTLEPSLNEIITEAVKKWRYIGKCVDGNPETYVIKEKIEISIR